METQTPRPFVREGEKRRSWERRTLRSAVLPHISGTRPATLKALIGLIDEYCQLRDGQCWASQQRLAEELGLSTTTVRRSLKALQQLGVLTSERKSRGGRMTVNHYRLVWRELALLVEQPEQPATPSTVQDAPINRSPCLEQVTMVAASTVHGERQEEIEKKQETTTTLLASIVDRLEQLLSSLAERLSGGLSVNPPENLLIAPAWRRLERAISSKGVKYASRATQACRERGESPDDVLALVQSSTAKTIDLANRLLHGTALPEPTTAAKAKPKTATDLWEDFCSWCSKKGLDRFAEIPRFETVLKRHGLEMPEWLAGDTSHVIGMEVAS